MFNVFQIWQTFFSALFRVPVDSSYSEKIETDKDKDIEKGADSNNFPPSLSLLNSVQRKVTSSSEGQQSQNSLPPDLQSYSASIELPPASWVFYCATFFATLIFSAIISLAFTGAFVILDILTDLIYSLSLDKAIDGEKIQDFLFIHALASLVFSFILWNVLISFALLTNRYAHELHEDLFLSAIRLFVCANFFMPMLADLFLQKVLNVDQPNALGLTFLCKGAEFSLVCAVLFCLYITKRDGKLTLKIAANYLDLENKLESTIPKQGFFCFCSFFSSSQDGVRTPTTPAGIPVKYCESSVASSVSEYQGQGGL